MQPIPSELDEVQIEIQGEMQKVEWENNNNNNDFISGDVNSLCAEVFWRNLKLCLFVIISKNWSNTVCWNALIQTNYGVHIVGILEKFDHIIMRSHCTSSDVVADLREIAAGSEDDSANSDQLVREAERILRNIRYANYIERAIGAEEELRYSIVIW